MVAVLRLHKMKYSETSQRKLLNQRNIGKQILTSISSLLSTNKHNKKQIDLDVVTSTS